MNHLRLRAVNFESQHELRLSNNCVLWERVLPQVMQPLRLLNTADLNALSPRCQRSAKAASGSPLGGCVGVQHSGALHPCPNRVHPGHHGLFFHTTPTPLDALVDAKHQNAPSHCRYLSHTFSLSSLSLLLSLAPSFFSPCLPSSGVCLIALSEEQSGVVYFTWLLVARVFLKVNKRCDMWKEKGSCRHPGLAAPHVSGSSRKRGGIGSCRDEQRESDERGSAG